MKSCAHCHKKFDGRPTQIYCGGSCKTAAYRSRHRQSKETKRRTLTSAERKDLSYIQERSADAYNRLMNIRANHGVECFDDALSAVYAAVIDTEARQV